MCFTYGSLIISVRCFCNLLSVYFQLLFLCSFSQLLHIALPSLMMWKENISSPWWLASFDQEKNVLTPRLLTETAIDFFLELSHSCGSSERIMIQNKPNKINQNKWLLMLSSRGLVDFLISLSLYFFLPSFLVSFLPSSLSFFSFLRFNKL